MDIKIGGELRVRKHNIVQMFRPADNDSLRVYIYVNVFLDMGFWTPQLFWWGPKINIPWE